LAVDKDPALTKVLKNYLQGERVKEKTLRDGLRFLISKYQDIQKEYNLEMEHRRELEHLIRVHPDTALPIYRFFTQDLLNVLEERTKHPRDSKTVVAILRLDDQYGRIKNTRDRNKVLLFKTGLRIQEVVGQQVYQSDRVDEFVILLKSVPNFEAAELMLERIIELIRRPHEPPAEDISFGCKIGYTIVPDDAVDFEQIINNAEIALGSGEGESKSLFRYTQTMGEEYRNHLKIEQELRTASQSGFEDFFLTYQPFVNSSNQITGCESLIRWNHQQMGMLSPDRFISIAEKTGDIRMLGRWIMYRSLGQCAEWKNKFMSDIHISVNLSPIQFLSIDLVGFIKDMLTANNMEGSNLKLEITEGIIMTDPDAAIKKMKQLRDFGIRISIDDFGTGYSSLNYLKKLPIDTLKIDKSFIDDITTNQSNQEIVRAMIGLAKSLKIETLAEGVESAEQRDLLFNEGCDYIQGYYYSPPVDAKQFTVYLNDGGELPR
jgi:EAL domain-containing protein (putative c-di-GMP-specific phosphodiesterase class I)/GGDEF domain-containing protein